MTTVSVKLTEADIDKYLVTLRAWMKKFEAKISEFLKALAQEGYDCAVRNYEAAIYDGTNDVSCKIEEIDERTVAVVAVGDSVLFVEFGTGVRYPNDHPEAQRLNMVHGEYGSKRGKNPKGWNYSGEPGTNGEPSTTVPNLIHTYGNPANTCLYRSKQEVENQFKEIAQRVFSK